MAGQEEAANSLGKDGREGQGGGPGAGQAGRRRAVRIEAYRGLAYHKNGEDKDAALAALKRLAPEKVEQALVDATKAKNPEVKRWASNRLGELD